MRSICLSMIVKDEERVIQRCLESVLPYIDAWVIVDTGSSDHTQEIVRETMGDLPGELVERPWKDFATNRSEALAVARERGYDYAFVIDADDIFSPEDGFAWPGDLGGSAQLHHDMNGLGWWRSQLFSLHLPWHYEGVVHEFPTTGPGVPSGRAVSIKGASVTITRDGSRSQQSNAVKYGGDAELLREALEDDPSDTRSAFYLAQSLRDAGRWTDAARAYRHRTKMGGFAEEVWYSHYQIAVVEHHLRRLDWPAIADLYMKAYRLRPTRIEPLVDLSVGHRAAGDHAAAYLCASAALHTPEPQGDILFVSYPAYTWRKLDELALAAYGLKLHDVARTIGEYAVTNAPEKHLPRLRRNLTYSPGSVADYDKAFGVMPDDRSYWRASMKEIYDAYVDKVSSKGRSASIELLGVLCATVRGLARTQKRVRVLDLGTGLSSAVLLRCAAEVEADLGGTIQVTSLDDSAEWLEKTRLFLAAHELDDAGLGLWPDDLGATPYDVVFYDLGLTETRIEELTKAFALGRILLIDDMHKPQLDKAVRDALSKCERNWELYDLKKVTIDSFKRFSWAVVFPPDGLLLELVEADPQDAVEAVAK